MSNADGDYLVAAKEAGQLGDIEGLAYVAGSYVEPVTGEHQCFIEWADPRLLQSETLPHLTTEVIAAHPRAQRVLLRAPAEYELPPPWRKHLTYVHYSGTAQPPGAHVRRSTAVQDLLVAGWLVRAFTTAGESFGARTSPQDASDLADAVLSSPDRESFVFSIDGTAVGHATMLCQARDPVSGEEFAELLDILVEPDFDVRGITKELVAACAVRAAALRRRLIGNVVHPFDSAAHGDKVVAALSRSGWSVAHRYWQRGTPP
jgi:hypothetical protein